MTAPRRLAAIPLAVSLLLVAGLGLWRAQLVNVDAMRSPARPLAVLAGPERAARPLDVVLPVVPVGMARLRSAERPLLIHYWAPWERHGRAQAAALDSLSRLLRDHDLRIVLVASDPFPSVARFVARQRLRVTVLLDGPGLLRSAVPRPELPHTVLLDRSGRAAISQSGEVDWLAPATREAIERVLAEPPPPGPAPPGTTL